MKNEKLKLLAAIVGATVAVGAAATMVILVAFTQMEPWALLKWQLVLSATILTIAGVCYFCLLRKSVVFATVLIATVAATANAQVAGCETQCEDYYAANYFQKLCAWVGTVFGWDSIAQGLSNSYQTPPQQMANNAAYGLNAAELSIMQSRRDEAARSDAARFLGGRAPRPTISK